MRKFLLPLFIFLAIVFVVSVDAKYGERWKVEYGCRGKGCVSGYVAEADRYLGKEKCCVAGGTSTCCNLQGTYPLAGFYSPAGFFMENANWAGNPNVNTPGQTGYAHCVDASGNTAGGYACFTKKDPITGQLLYTITRVDGYTTGGTQFKYWDAATNGWKILVLFSPLSAGGTGGGGGGGGTGVWVTATPTPTPTPTPVLGPWSKLKDASFLSGERIQSYIPASPVAYDTDDTTQPYFIVGDGGVVAASSIALSGLNGSAKANSQDWQDGAYSMPPPAMLPQDYITYVKGRKETKNITSLDQIDSDGIYVYTGTTALDITSVPATLNQYNMVLVSEMQVNINPSDDFFKPEKSVAIVSPVIDFGDNVKEAKGIFISLKTDTGTTTDQGLKIVGNLLVNDEFDFNRKWTNLNRPRFSLFLGLFLPCSAQFIPFLSEI